MAEADRIERELRSVSAQAFAPGLRPARKPARAGWPEVRGTSGRTSRHVVLRGPEQGKAVHLQIEAARIETDETRRPDCPSQAGCSLSGAEQDAVMSIAEKVARVVELIYWDWDHLGELQGETKLEFIMSQDGYVERFRIVARSGEAVLTRESANALLMASPFAYTDGWIELKLTFRG
jgi:hypothetical protein